MFIKNIIIGYIIVLAIKSVPIIIAAYYYTIFTLAKGNTT